MPYNSYTTEEDLKKQQEGQQVGQPVANPSESTALQSSASVGGGSSVGKGTSFTNLQNYIANNAGQGAATTQRIIDPKQQQIDSAVKSLNDDVQKTQKDIAAGTVQKNKALEVNIGKDPLKSVDEFKSYTSQSYKGPQSYNPSGDVYNNYNKVETKLDIGNVANPGEIKKNLGDSTYNAGMGALDSYLVNAEGQGAVQAYNDKNKNVMADRDKAIQGVNDSIGQAKQVSTQNIASAQSAADKAYADHLTAAKESRYAGYDKDFNDARTQINSKLKAAGEAPVTDINAWVSPNSAYSWQDAIDPTQLAALNALAGIDSDTTTNGFVKGNNKAVNIDWSAIDKLLEKPAVQPPEVTRTDYPTKGGDAGGKGETRVTHADGSYTVTTDSGVVINYNADGTIKGQIEDKKGVLT